MSDEPKTAMQLQIEAEQAQVTSRQYTPSQNALMMAGLINMTKALVPRFPSQDTMQFDVFAARGIDYFRWSQVIGGVGFVGVGVLDYKKEEETYVAWSSAMRNRIEITRVDLERFIEKHLNIMRENVQRDLERLREGGRSSMSDLEHMILRGDMWRDRAIQAESEVVRLKEMVKEREELAEKYCGMLDEMVKVQEEEDNAEQVPQAEEKREFVMPKLSLPLPEHLRAKSCSCGTPDNLNFEHGWTGCFSTKVKMNLGKATAAAAAAVAFPDPCQCGDPHNKDVNHDPLGCTWKRLEKR